MGGPAFVSAIDHKRGCGLSLLRRDLSFLCGTAGAVMLATYVEPADVPA